MKRISMLAGLVAAAAPANAQAVPYKLIIVANNSTVAIDYPTLSRCMAGKAEAQAEASRRAEAQKRLTPGVIMDAPLRIIAFCIPG